MKKRLTAALLAALLLIAVVPARAVSGVFSFVKTRDSWNTGHQFTNYYLRFTLATGPYGGTYTMTFPYSNIGSDVQTFTVEADSTYELVYDYHVVDQTVTVHYYPTVTWTGPEGLSGSFSFDFTGPRVSKSIVGITVKKVGSGSSILGTPTALEWGSNGSAYADGFGTARWTPSGMTDGEEKFMLWRVGEASPLETVTYIRVVPGEMRSWNNFVSKGFWKESGDYYFTVYEIGKDGHADGSAARSEVWHYEKASAAIQTPVIDEIVRRQTGSGNDVLYIYLKEEPGAVTPDQYVIDLYHDELSLGYSAVRREYVEVCEDGRLRLSITDWFTSAYGAGEYGFTVYAAGDLSKVQPSERSAVFTVTLDPEAGGEWMEEGVKAYAAEDGVRVVIPPVSAAQAYWCAAYDDDGRLLEAALLRSSLRFSYGCTPEEPFFLSCDAASVASVKVFYLSGDNTPVAEAQSCTVTH